MVRVTVFMVSDAELDADWRQVGDLFRDLSDMYLDRGVDLRTARWDPREPDEGMRESNRRLMEESDLCVFLFLSRVDPGVVGELDRLIVLTRGKDAVDGEPGRPRVAVWFRDSPDGGEPSAEVRRLRKRLVDEFGHFWNKYANIDSLKLDLVMVMLKCFGDGSGLEIRVDGDDAGVYLGGQWLDVDLDNVASYRGYEKIQDLERRYRQCDLAYRALREEHRQKPDDKALRDRYAEVASEHADLLKALDHAYEDYLKLLNDVAAANDGKRALTPRLAGAYHAIQDGDVPHALDVLSVESIMEDAEHDMDAYEAEQAAADVHLRLADKHKADLRDRVRELLARDDALRSLPDTSESRDDRRHTLEVAARLEHDTRLGVTAQNRLADYLYNQHDYTGMERVLASALQLARDLAQRNPNTYNPGLALTLRGLALLHRDVNQLDESEAELDEALVLYRTLARRNPDSCKSDLALTLNSLALLHTDIGCFGEAEAEFSEALRLDRGLVQGNPDAYNPNLAETLNNFAVLHYYIGQFNEAEIEYNEALTLRRNFASRNPYAYNPDLAEVWYNLAILHYKNAQFDKAETEFGEALNLYRNLAQGNPNAYNARLALTLNHIALLHSDADVGRLGDAEIEYSEAIALYRDLVLGNPNAYNFDLALTLNNLASLHRDVGRFGDAEAEYEEALTLYRNLVHVNPNVNTFDHGLAAVLNGLALLHVDNGRLREAEVGYGEAIALYRNLAHADPGVYDSDLAGTLDNLAQLHFKIGRFGDAESEYGEALNIRRHLAQNNPGAYDSDLAGTLNNIAALHFKVGQLDKAETEFNESLDLYRALARGNSGAHDSDLIRVLSNIAALHNAAGRVDLAKQDGVEVLRLAKSQRNPDKALIVSITKWLHQFDVEEGESPSTNGSD